MKQLGKVLHLSNSRKLILRTKVKVKPGIKVLNAKRKQVGLILDIFGPVRNPYISIKPSIINPDYYIGRNLYIINTCRN